MAKYTGVNVDKLKEQAKEYDYIRFTWSCLHGIPSGKTVGTNVVNQFLENGVTAYEGIVAMGPGNELVTIPQFMDTGCSNLFCKPACDSITSLPWCTQGKFRVGEVLCEQVKQDGSAQVQCPRYIARTQINKLAEMGLKIYSAPELECMVVDKKTMQPLFAGNDFLKVFSFSENETMFFEFDQMLRKCGITIETFQCEFGPGQVEFALKPVYGIEGADTTFRFKQGVKEMCSQRGYHMTCMTRPFFTNGCSNGTHFNFSLWDDNGKNVFSDTTKEDRLSDTALYFVGGLLKHAKALTAICSPTVNCYRRLHNPWAPDVIDWDMDNRFTMIRVKAYSEKETYIENRLPSGSSNPYLVMAATIAAGIDGINNKIKPPEKGGNSKAEALPYTLEESIAALKEDSYMVEALGPEFVDWFVICKEQIDFAKFKNHNVRVQDADEIEAERKEFYTFM